MKIKLSLYLFLYFFEFFGKFGCMMVKFLINKNLLEYKTSFSTQNLKTLKYAWVVSDKASSCVYYSEPSNQTNGYLLLIFFKYTWGSEFVYNYSEVAFEPKSLKEKMDFRKMDTPLCKKAVTCQSLDFNNFFSSGPQNLMSH